MPELKITPKHKVAFETLNKEKGTARTLFDVVRPFSVDVHSESKFKKEDLQGAKLLFKSRVNAGNFIEKGRTVNVLGEDGIVYEGTLLHNLKQIRAGDKVHKQGVATKNEIFTLLEQE